MKIIDVKKTKNSGLVDIIFENDDIITIDEEDYLKYGLYNNKELSIKEFDEIKVKIKYKMAKTIALKYLVRQLRSIVEVERKLKSYDFDDDVISMAINELKSMGYLNDRMYAHKFIFDRIKNNPKSKKMLIYELKQKGINEDIIDEVIDDMSIDDIESGIFLAKKKMMKLDMEEKKSKKKIMNFLKNRGYSMDLIKKILKSVKE